MPDLSIFLSLFGLYAITIAAGAWFVLRTESRRRFQQQLQQQLKSTSSGMAAFCTAVLGVPSRAVGQVGSMLNTGGATMLQGLRQHRKSALIATALLLLPAACAVLLGSRGVLEGYDDSAREMDPVVASLLQGEHLVSPPPLPPEVFVTKDLMAQRTDLAGASRDWNLLDDGFRQRLLAVYRLMAMHGYDMALIEGYRTPQRQSALARLGPHVTNVGAYQSYHQYGLAADSAFYLDGKIVISEKDPKIMEGYRLFGKYAESVGLVWGGRWKMMDFGHVELHRPGTIAKN